jgi:tRNA isopentenyl-2-thiomethyl-A-37 hydroxylase MiaE
MDEISHEDLSSLDVRHVRGYCTELIAFYMGLMRDRSRHIEDRLHAAQCAQ